MNPENNHPVFDGGMDALDRVSDAAPFTPLTAAVALLMLSIVLFSFWWNWK